ncbi:MAG TPA: OmcA/MtrC family decaheme c-type cytochrome [Kofleriaceae bacterium]
MRRYLIVCLLSMAGCGDNGGRVSGGEQPPWLSGDRVDIAVTDLAFDKGTAAVTFTLKDKDGTPLDRAGRLTPGKVNVGFVLAQLGLNGDDSPGQYTAFTTRTATATPPYPEASATQATTESVEESFETVDAKAGIYRYTFKAPLTGYDSKLTQSVLAVAVREVDDVESIDRDLFHVGDMRREEVTPDTCNSCHATLRAHGGRYTQPDQCILCHTGQTSDPETGNTVDFRVMIHKIHRGDDLPSLRANPDNHYTIVGFGGAVHDFSDVGFPGPTTSPGTNISRCEACHAGAQRERWATRPSIETCTSCHDTTIFSADANPPFTVAHQGGVDPVLVNNSTCVICHAPTSGVAPITQTHYLGVLDPSLPKLAFAIDSITNTAPGQLPTIRFRVTVNDQPRDIITMPLTSLAATIAGPTTDFAEYWQARIQGTGAVGTLTAVDAASGVFDYTLPATGCTESTRPHDCAMPANTRGSFKLGLEGYIQDTPASTRVAASPPMLTFAVAGPAMDRRVIVDNAKCNGCHYDLQFHGGTRKDANYCVLCHNPNNANDERISRVEGSTVFAESVDFRVMIHKIHMGDELMRAYVLGGNPAPSAMNPVGVPEDFSHVRYPRSRTECDACHVSATWTVPMDRSPAYLPSTTVSLTCSEPAASDANNYCDAPFWQPSQTDKLAPETSVCTSCHDAPYTAAHALLNTLSTGVEACATCHGSGREFDVARVHGMQVR